MLRYLIAILATCLLASCGAKVAGTEPAQAEAKPRPMQTQLMRFTANDLSLSALLDTPTNGEAKALVIFVHGYGPTNVVEQNWYYDLRSRFAKQGVSSFVWDKPGQGKSEGIFDANQPVESSAAEVVAAAQFLRANDVPGSQKIGIWGISRAGWIAPLAMVQDENIEFWISVSGVDANESFGYLLQSNWRLQGYSEKKTEHLYTQWKHGVQVAANQGSFDEYKEATADIRQDPFFAKMTNSQGGITPSAYHAIKADYLTLDPVFDEKTGLVVYVENFAQLLSALDIDTLAIFGEKDSIVDWRSTRKLYEYTIGRNPEASLEVITFPDGNHNLHQSETGSFDEMVEILDNPKTVDGYYTKIEHWLDNTVVNEN